MKPMTRSHAIDEDRLHDLIAEYLRRVDRGEQMDQSAFIGAHPEFAEALQAYFENETAIDSLFDVPAAGVPRPSATESLTDATLDTSVPAGDQTIPPIPEVFGRYRVLKALGQGAMGAVYLARDQQLGRSVALKIPKFKGADSTGMLERFYREARSAALLRHPNLCPVFDVGEIDGQHYISMAYIEGRPLSDLIHTDPLLAERDVADIVRKIALALSEAHSHGVIHRDLKPANIMIDLKGEPVVMDFGLAQCAAHQDLKATKEGAIIGTIAYMSPEQASGDRAQIGPKSDIYSLGVILYEMLTGRVPFTGDLMSVFKQIAVDEPKPPSQLHPQVDPRLEAICLRMIAKHSAGRYSSMIEVAQALGKFSETDQEALPSNAGATATQQSVLKSLAARYQFAATAIVASTLLVVSAIAWKHLSDAEPSVKEVVTSKAIEKFAVSATPTDNNAAYPIVTDAADGVLPKVDPISFSTDRAAAEWALAIKGTVSIRTSDGTRSVKTSAELPMGSFAVTEIHLGSDNQRISGLEKLTGLKLLKELHITGSNSSVRDNMLIVLPELPSLQRLGLTNAPITDLGMTLLSRCPNLEQLEIFGTRISDVGFRDVRNLSKLKTIHLPAKVTNDGLDPLTECRDLEVVHFIYSPVTAAGLRKLAALPKLRTLWMWNCNRATDAELEVLQQFSALKELNLAGTSVTDGGMQWLATHPRLSNLAVDRTSLTDAGLESLAINLNLTRLSLHTTQLSDAGMKHLSRMKSLRELNLDMTSISDDGLAELASLKALQEIRLVDTKVTADGVVVLKKALPDCKVIFNAARPAKAQ